MSVIGSNILAGASGQGGDYTIARSLRFRSSASAYLNRTFALGNRRTWTFSAWVKRGALGSQQNILHTYDGSAANRGAIRFNSDDTLAFDTGGASGSFGATITQMVFRDPSAWYHIVVTLDTTQATGANRQRIWVNGVQQTLTVTATAAQNYDGQINLNQSHQISSTNGSTPFLDGYLAEVNFIDGQALTPSSFGANNASTGVWQPKKYTGTYGTNGFYLPFTNTASTSTLGNDFSGNGNNWTTNNISLTAGATYDSMTDVPTLTSATAANYCVWNAAAQSTVVNGSVTRSNGNLTSTDGGTTYGLASFGTIGVTTGKWYWETTLTAAGGTFANIGVIDLNSPLGANLHTGICYAQGGNKTSGSTAFNGSGASAYGASYSAGDVIGVALNLDAGEITFYKNGTSQGVAYTGISGNYTPAVGDGQNITSYTFDLNCGQRPFAYTPPTGFVALNTYNLPTPTIGATASTQANKYFNATTYTGDGTNSKVITTGGGADFVWIKRRDSATSHILFDAVRGAGKTLYSHLTNAEVDNGGYYVQSFGNTGFTLGTGGDAADNANGGSYVAWSWDANGAGSSNTAGSITSTVSANTSAGFSVVTYTGTGSAATVGHGLGVAPKMIIVKRRDSSVNWAVYTAMTGNTNFLQLNTTVNSTAQGGNNFWNSTNPTSTVFSVGTITDTNASGGTYVAYCFAEVAGYSRFGSYTGNGSTDGTFVYTGFKPKYVMVKRTDSADVWLILDAVRDTYNVVGNLLQAQSSDADQFVPIFDYLSNGFKLKATGNPNNNGGTFIYMAFAEHPFKYSLAR